MTTPYFKNSVARRLRDPISITNLQTMLLLVDCDIDREFLCRWTAEQRAIAEDWACRIHLRASDNIIRVPAKPSFVTKAETLSLFRPRSRTAFTEAVLEKKQSGTLHLLLIRDRKSKISNR